jgi:hypothetical protein
MLKIARRRKNTAAADILHRLIRASWLIVYVLDLDVL